MKKLLFPLLLMAASASAQTIREDIKKGTDGSKLYIKNADRSLVVSKSPMRADAPLVILDDKMIPSDSLNKLNTNDIASMTILKDKIATDKYGDRARFGALEITSKKANSKAD